jgi:TRAP-type C4-dicarboxylate transport system permease small subunit
MDLLTRTDALMERIAKAGRLVSSFLLLAMVVLINVEVFGRYLFGFSTLIADEYSAYLFVGCTFLGFVYSFRRGHFLRVTLLVDRLWPKTQMVLHLISSMLGTILSWIVTWKAFKLAYLSFVYDSVSIQPSMTPLFIPQMVMPLGMGCMAMLFGNEVLQTAWKLRKHPDIPGGGNVP